MKLFLKYIGVGAATVLLFGGIVIALLVAIPRDNRIRDPINGILSALCKPLDWMPSRLGDMLAERQDPLLSLSVMIGYWIMIGAVLGALAWTINHWILKRYETEQGVAPLRRTRCAEGER